MKSFLATHVEQKPWWQNLPNKLFFYPAVGALFIIMSLQFYYRGGSLILGGEGSFVLDFLGHLEITTHNWLSRFGVGAPNLGPGSNGAYIIVLALVDTFFKNQHNVLKY